MAMIRCHECSNAMSSTANACPHCGAPPRKKTSWIAWLGVLLVGAMIYKCTSTVVDTTSRAVPSHTSEADKQKEREFQTVVAGANWLKQSVKNPASFELVSARLIGDDVACYEYRATNSFNAVVPGHRVISNSVNSGEAKDWNRHCAGKTGTDYSYARRALR